MLAILALVPVILFIFSLLRHIDFKNIDYLDGILAGTVYFIISPLIFALIDPNGVSSPFVNIGPYKPQKDLDTSLVLAIGLTSIGILYLSKKFVTRRHSSTAASANGLIMALTLYFLLLVLLAVKLRSAGVGGHWHEAIEYMQRHSASFAIMKSFANALRFLIPGFIVYVVHNKMLSPAKGATLVLVVVTIDVLTSYNRIGLVYAAIAILFIYQRHWKLIVLCAAIAMPLVSPLSAIWTIYRGLHSGQSTNVSMMDSWQQATDILISNPTATVTDMRETIFEASNIASLSYVVQKLPDEIGFRWGETMLLRPLTTFLPSAVWSDKPPVFSTYVGEYGNNKKGSAINSSPIGEAFGNFGYFFPIPMVLLFLLWAKLFEFFNKFLPGTRTAGFFAGIAGMRFDMSFYSLTIYTLVLLLIFTTFIRLLGRIK